MSGQGRDKYKSPKARKGWVDLIQKTRKKATCKVLNEQGGVLCDKAL